MSRPPSSLPNTRFLPPPKNLVFGHLCSHRLQQRRRHPSPTPSSTFPGTCGMRTTSRRHGLRHHSEPKFGRGSRCSMLTFRPRSEPERAWAVYGASKAQSEQAAWEFMKEKKPHFILNTVLPNANFGNVSSGIFPNLISKETEVRAIHIRFLIPNIKMDLLLHGSKPSSALHGRKYRRSPHVSPSRPLPGPTNADEGLQSTMSTRRTLPNFTWLRQPIQV